METPLLAAALIVKNEERYLPDCLAALNELRPLLSEICIYDTGSTDRTVQIAREAGAQVELGFWDDDFSRARNEAIAMCNAKWVLIVDADERVVADVRKLERSLREALHRNLVGDTLLKVQCDMINEQGMRTTSFMSPRILRPGRAEYVGRVHELPQPRAGIMGAGKSEISGDVVRLRHVGYVAEAMAGKADRNLALAGAETMDAISDGRELADLELMNRARSKRLAGDLPGSVSDLRALRRRRRNTQERLWGGEWLAAIFVDAGDGFEARPLIRELETEGSHPELLKWLSARLLRAEGRYAEALDLLRSIDVPVGADGTVSQPIDLLAARFHCAVNCDEHDEAVACGIRLVAQYAQFDPYLRMLLRIWSPRPAQILAQLIVEFGEAQLSIVLSALDDLGDQATELRLALAAIERGSRSFVTTPNDEGPPRPTGRGSAFGITR